MSVHTPGPWETSLNDEGQWDVCTEGGGDMIADLSDCPENAEANTRLTAAAPELLLAALKRPLLAPTGGKEKHEAVAEAHAAIAKAEGREPTRKPTEQERLEEAKAKHAAGPGKPVSKRPRRTSAASTPPVHPSNPCRSVRRVHVQPRRGNRSKTYTKSLSPASSTVSARSGTLNKLLNSIRESVRHLELLLGGVL